MASAAPATNGKLNGANRDAFGLLKGSKASQAAAMFARTSGATMKQVSDKLGKSFYNLLKHLTTAGYMITKEEHTIYLA